MIQSDQKQVETPGIAYKNKHVIFAILLIGILMSVLDGFMVNIALPDITAYFGVGISLSQWIITGYLLAMTGLFIFFGKLSEYTGKTKLYIAGFALFTLSSFACAFAPGINEMIVFRIAQGIGASMVAGISGAITFEVFPPEERGKAMGGIAATYGIVALIAPGVGGFITGTLGWRYIFLVNVPIGIVMLALALKYMKLQETTSGRLNIDWAGTGALIISVASLMLLCSEMANGISMNATALAYGAVFVLASIAFLYRESRCKSPLLDLSLFMDKKFTLPIMSMAISYMVINMINVLGPFYLQGAMGYTPSQVGLLFMLPPLAMIFAAPVSGMLYDKHHWKLASTLGLLVLAMAFFVQGCAFFGASLVLILAAFALRGIGDGIFQSINSVEIMSALRPEKYAIASSVSSTVGNLASALGAMTAGMLLMFELNSADYNGSVMAAGPILLSNSIGSIMLVAGVLCVMAMAASALKNI
jgi:EmrB/QacA subfamily drug resistance transporter